MMILDRGFTSLKEEIKIRIKECVSFPFTIGPMEIMPKSKPYDHNGLWDVKTAIK